jgi:hypothetical protein
VGDVIAFRTAAGSSAGEGVVGLIRIEKQVQITNGRAYIEIAVKIPAE